MADLANLELTAEEKGRMIRDLNSILEHIEMLNELDTSDVPPLAESGQHVCRLASGCRRSFCLCHASRRGASRIAA